MKQPPREIDQYPKRLGAGSFGVVTRDTWIATGEPVAVKRLHKLKLTDNRQHDDKIYKKYFSHGSMMDREAGLLELLSHPNIVKIVYYENETLARTLVMEYVAGGDLWDLLIGKNSKAKITFNNRAILAQDVAKGMKYIHGKKIIHCDLKSENILVDRDGDGIWHAKVADFGCAFSYGHATAGPQGTRKCLPPAYFTLRFAFFENFSERFTHSYGTDVYAFALVMWQILTRKPLFHDIHNARQLYEYYEIHQRPPIPKESELKDAGQIIPESFHTYNQLLTRCWATSANDRPDANQIEQQLGCLLK